MLEQGNRKMIVDLLAMVLDLNVTAIERYKWEKLQSLKEYQFSLMCLKVRLVNGERIDVYLKMINRSQIKETIFCYWCLLYELEKKKRKKRIYEPIQNTVDRVYISEISKERFKNSVFLSMKKNKEGIMKYGAEAHLIDFIKYIENQQRKENGLRKWLNYLGKQKEDILFIGMKTSRTISKGTIEIV